MRNLVDPYEQPVMPWSASERWSRIAANRSAVVLQFDDSALEMP